MGPGCLGKAQDGSRYQDAWGRAGIDPGWIGDAQDEYGMLGMGRAGSFLDASGTTSPPPSPPHSPLGYLWDEL